MNFLFFIAAVYCGGRSCLLKGCRSLAESIAEVVVLSPQKKRLYTTRDLNAVSYTTNDSQQS